jgi:transcriptional regulator with XRE-family HTH domain
LKDLPTFRDALESGWKRRALTQTDVAKEIGVSLRTLNSWLRRETFPAAASARLAELAGLGPSSPERLEERFQLRFSQPRSTSLGASTADVSSSGFGRGTAIEAEQELSRMYESLGQDDVVFQLDADVPVEWERSYLEGSVGRHLVSAVGRGARFVYVLPANDQLVQWSAMVGEPQPPPIEALFGYFSTNLDRLASLERRSARDQVFLLRTGVLPFFMRDTVTYLVAQGKESRLNAMIAIHGDDDSPRLVSAVVPLRRMLSEQIAESLRGPLKRTKGLSSSLLPDRR